MPTRETVLLDAHAVDTALDGMASEIVGRGAGDGEPPLLVGIHTRGVLVAERLRKRLAETGMVCPTGSIDISLYRDDLADRGAVPVLLGSDISVPVDGTRVILCDDVLYTGRTIRAALEAIHALGRPACVELVVLVDRGHRELPIQADVAGHFVETRPEQHVRVRLEESDGADAVVLLEKVTDTA